MKPYIANLPDNVRVGPFDIKIIKWSHLEAASCRRWGEFSSQEQIIRIDAEIVTPFKAVDTFLHEISHAISWAYSIADEDKEERRVSMLGTAWTQVFRDNRWLLTWIDSTLHTELN